MSLTIPTLVWSLGRYETDEDNLVNNVWAAGDNVYLDDTTLLPTNNVTLAIADIGAWAEVVEAPDIEVVDDRCVVRVTATGVTLRESLYRVSAATSI